MHFRKQTVGIQSYFKKQVGVMSLLFHRHCLFSSLPLDYHVEITQSQD